METAWRVVNHLGSGRPPILFFFCVFVVVVWCLFVFCLFFCFCLFCFLFWVFFCRVSLPIHGWLWRPCRLPCCLDQLTTGRVLACTFLSDAMSGMLSNRAAVYVCVRVREREREREREERERERERELCVCARARACACMCGYVVGVGAFACVCGRGIWELGRRGVEGWLDVCVYERECMRLHIWQENCLCMCVWFVYLRECSRTRVSV